MSSRPVRAVSKSAPTPSSLATEGLLLLNAALETIAFDEGATSMLLQESAEGETSRSPLPLPREIRDALKAVNAGDLPAPKVNLSLGQSSYSCHIFSLRQSSDAERMPLFALYLQRYSSVSEAVHLLASEYNLTDREQQALQAIAAGLTSKEIAKKMMISPNTVKSFLRIIMLKMGVGSRAAMIGKLLDYGKGRSQAYKQTR